MYAWQIEELRRMQHRNNAEYVFYRKWLEITERIARGGGFHYSLLSQYRAGPYRLDFCDPSIQLDIEIDGPSHETREGKAYDKKRTGELEERGWTITRIPHREVYACVDEPIYRVIQQIDSMVPPYIPYRPSTGHGPDYHPGGWVKHRLYGIGVVTAVKCEMDVTTVYIRFQHSYGGFDPSVNPSVFVKMP